MSKSTIAILIYILGLIFGALVLDLWSADTGPKAFIGIIWTVVLLISLFYADKYEKKLWRLEDTSSKWKKDNLIKIQKRLSGWQLESFKDSYKHKVENGISLFKKNLDND